MRSCLNSKQASGICAEESSVSFTRGERAGEVDIALKVEDPAPIFGARN
jgi:hypothetical protein